MKIIPKVLSNYIVTTRALIKYLDLDAEQRKKYLNKLDDLLAKKIIFSMLRSLKEEEIDEVRSLLENNDKDNSLIQLSVVVQNYLGKEDYNMIITNESDEVIKNLIEELKPILNQKQTELLIKKVSQEKSE